jgi:DNA-binding Xre family transcriptional regulator
MIAIKLREAMQRYKRQTGRKMTYRILAELSGVAEPTLHSIGSREHYNATLATIEKVCWALDVAPGDLLELIDDRPKPKRAAGRKRGGA